MTKCNACWLFAVPNTTDYSVMFLSREALGPALLLKCAKHDLIYTSVYFNAVIFIFIFLLSSSSLSLFFFFFIKCQYRNNFPMDNNTLLPASSTGLLLLMMHTLEYIHTFSRWRTFCTVQLKCVRDLVWVHLFYSNFVN